MKYFCFLTLLLSLATSATAQENYVFRAMQDEMTRNIKELKKDDLAKPYFISYEVKEINGFSSAAEFGSLKYGQSERFYNARASMRVGSSKEDNSYFKYKAYYPAAAAGGNYDGLRFSLWEITDRAYKNALAQLAKKQAFKKNKRIQNETEDFSFAPTVCVKEKPNKPAIDKLYWQKVAKRASGAGNEQRALDYFSARVNIDYIPSYFLSSEGACYFNDTTSIKIIFRAKARSKEGLSIDETKIFRYSDINDVPKEEKIASLAKDFAKTVSALTSAKKPSPYIGPVLLENAAAADFLDALLAWKIIKTKEELSSDDASDLGAGFWRKYKGARIMPAYFDVIDDPLSKTFNGFKLTGYYAVDKEGVAPQKLQLVKNGELLNLPTTRSLMEGQTKSSGRARILQGNYYRAGISNLFFLARKTVPDKNLKTFFTRYCAEEGFDYCYIIRSLASNKNVSLYKVNAKTGEETPVIAANVNLDNGGLRDIKIAGDEAKVYSYSYNMLFDGYNTKEYDYSIITPSLILSELMIEPSDIQPERSRPLAKP